MLSEVDGLRARCVNMEERFEVEREDHNKDLDQLRDECKCNTTNLFIFRLERFKKSFAGRIYILKARDDAMFANKKRKTLHGVLRRKTEIRACIKHQLNNSRYYSLCYSRGVNEYNRPNVGARVMPA